MFSRLLHSTVLTAAICLALPSPASAISLPDALGKAYENNPTLKAERKKMEGSYEAMPDARANLLPQLNAHYDNGNQKGNANNGRDQKYHPKSYSLNLSQPLFRGGRTYNALQQADDIINAATFALQNSEQRVFLEAIDAYLTLAEAREIYTLNLHNENVLKEQLSNTQDGFKLGETTRTDVSQAESRYAAATSRRITAHGDLMKAESNFRRLFIIEPDETIHIPAALPQLPDNLDALITTALAHDPTLQLSYYNNETSKEGVDIAKGALLPTVSLDGNSTARDGGGVGQLDSLESNAITLNVSVPLYQGGGEYADVRRARKSASEANFRLDQERYNTRNRATSAWESLIAARGAIDAQSASVKAAETALDGVKQEQQVGSRTVLDVLNAEQELFQAKVNYVNARGAYVNAAYQVLASMGTLTAQSLHLPVKLYDPQEEYNRLKYKFIGW